MHPVPGYPVTTPYGRRGPYWSCDEDSSGNGIHTGADIAAPVGTAVVAARPGKAVFSNHGAAFGYHQLDVVCDDGTRDFYAHMTFRFVDDGARVEAGERVGKVGAEGNVTGAHLHFERHATQYGGWSCSVVRDPAPSLNYLPSGSGGSGSGNEDDMPKYGHARIDKAVKLNGGEWTPIEWDKGSENIVNPGSPGLSIAGPYVLTLYARVNDRNGATIQTDAVEWDDDEAVQNTPGVMHDRDDLADTRQGSIQEGRRLRLRVKCGHDATLAEASLNVCYWPS